MSADQAYQIEMEKAAALPFGEGLHQMAHLTHARIHTSIRDTAQEFLSVIEKHKTACGICKSHVR